jgi:hypothetical protein
VRKKYAKSVDFTDTESEPRTLKTEPTLPDSYDISLKSAAFNPDDFGRHYRMGMIYGILKRNGAVSGCK